MNSNPAAKSLCAEVHTLLKLYMTVPVTRVDSLDLVQIAKLFTSVNERRCAFFGKMKYSLSLVSNFFLHESYRYDVCDIHLKVAPPTSKIVPTPMLK